MQEFQQDNARQTMWANCLIYRLKAHRPFAQTCRRANFRLPGMEVQAEEVDFLAAGIISGSFMGGTRKIEGRWTWLVGFRALGRVAIAKHIARDSAEERNHRFTGDDTQEPEQ